MGFAHRVERAQFRRLDAAEHGREIRLAHHHQYVRRGGEVEGRLAGELDRVLGCIFGEMLDCVQPGGQDYTMQQVILHVLERYDVPIVYGLKSGHVSSSNITLPIGVRAELTASGATGELRILESSTV